MANLIHNPFHKAETPKSKEESLTTILSSPEQRSELTLLLANSTSLMRKTITDIFDPRYAGKPSDRRYDNAHANANLNPSKADDEELDKERDEAEKRIKELSAPEMQVLKQAALDFFDDWRSSVIGRVGQVLNAKDEVESHKDDIVKKVKSEDNARSESKRLEPEPGKAEAKKPSEESVTEAAKHLYPPVKTPLAGLEEEKKKLILHSLMLLLLSLEHYAAHSRILLLYISSSLNLSVEFLAEDEGQIAKGLLKAAEAMNADKEKEKKAEENHSSRVWKVGLASVAGAGLLAVTGGLAAPLLAAGIGSVMGGVGLAGTSAAVYLGAIAESSVIVGGLFGAYGGRMTGKMMDEYAKEVEDFSFVPIRKSEKEYRRLRVAICISGWLTDKEEVVKPWRIISPTIEGFALKYEVEALLQLGNAMTVLLKSTAFAYAKKEILRRTILAAMTEALWPLALLRVAKIVDNPFSVALARSDKAGEVLAMALINKAQGERPVSLVGYSLGARVIYRCLMTLADRKAFGLIESVALLGSPAPSDSADWRKMRSVVSGRLINVYSENDYILGFLYRTSSIQYGVAGLRSAEYVKGVENVDVSDMVSGHLRYRYLTGAILKRIGFEDIDLEEVHQEEEELEVIEKNEEKETKEHQEKSEKEHLSPEQEKKALEKEIEKKNEQSMMDWATSRLQLGSDKAAALWGGLGGKSEKKKEEAIAK